jgi:DNA-3-methyladenine glycosylase I
VSFARRPAGRKFSGTAKAGDETPSASLGLAVVRCPWATREPAISYHDTEWGVPQHDDRLLFELLTLEGAQAGLSWDTILKKRAGYRAAFDHFDPAAVAVFDAARIAALAADPRIVRHRGKIASAVANAAAFLRVQRECGSFAAYLWGFVGGVPVVTRWPPSVELPARTALSDAISAALRARGFSFVGSTIVYAFLQATGVVDDHRAACFRAAFAVPGPEPA